MNTLRQIRLRRLLMVAAILIRSVVLAQSTGTAFVRHAPVLNSGTVEGSLQQLLGENVSFNGGATLSGDLLVPGTPTVRLNGGVNYAGTIDGTGAAAPSNYQVTLNGAVSLRNIIRRTNAVALPVVNAPPSPAGTRTLTINASGQTAGDFATLRHFTLNGNAGQFAVPPGTYGDFTANGASGFTLGIAGAVQPSVYYFQRLTLNGQAQLQVIGPVVITIADRVAVNGIVGSAVNPAWLTLNIYSGGLTLNGGAVLNGQVNAPRGSVIINGESQLRGGVSSDALTVNGRGVLRVLSNANQPPSVALIAPAAGEAFNAPATVNLVASARDVDGSVALVDFFQDGLLVGNTSLFPYQFSVNALLAGNYSFTARATDNRGATATSAPLRITVAGVNHPPLIQLTAPTPGAVFNVPAMIALGANAADGDGAVTKVEFFQGASKLGESLQAPFGLVWSGMLPGNYSLTAKAYDNQNASATSPPTSVVVQASLPYVTGFEATEGYVLGSIGGQGAWVSNGAAAVSDVEFHHGLRALIIDGATLPSEVSQSFPNYTGQPVIFVDVEARLGAGTDPTVSAGIVAETAKLALVNNTAAQAEFFGFDGDGGSGGTWRASGVAVGLNTAGRTAEWHRITLRLDFANKRWDLYVNARLAAYDLGFTNASALFFERLILKGSAVGSSAIDEVYIGFENPLFIDADKDGMDDAWEIAAGLNPMANDRTADADADGLTNIQEFQLGTKPGTRDSDGDGMPDGWEVINRLNPIANDANADLDGDGVTNLQEFLLGRNPTKGAVPDLGHVVNLRLFTPTR